MEQNKRSLMAKKQWHKNREKMISAMKNSKKVQRSIRKACAVQKALWKNDPVWREKMSKQLKEKSIRDKKNQIIRANRQWKFQRAKMLKANRTKTCRLKKSRASKKAWRDGKFDKALENKKNAKFRTWAKGGYYKGIWMRSSWEIAYAKWLDSKNIKWIHEPKVFKFKNGRHYTPDFYLPERDTWIEVKGWMCDRSRRKIRMFKKEFPKQKLKIIREGRWKKFINLK